MGLGDRHTFGPNSWDNPARTGRHIIPKLLISISREGWVAQITQCPGTNTWGYHTNAKRGLFQVSFTLKGLAQSSLQDTRDAVY